MASGQSGDAVRQINRLFQDGTVGALTDGQLIERFAGRRGDPAESAFEAMVARHGPMVLRVCRGLLRDAHDVEDAFQATFLVLVRKAGSIGERELLSPWLYGVAYRVSLKARAASAKRRRREGAAVDDPPADAAEAPWLDLRPVLHEELNRLPDKYRRPVVLCHLEGMTHAEAARELAWPVGTVSVRLARARKILRDRLSRRGLTATGALWAADLSAGGASVAVPALLLSSTTRAAFQFAAGRSLVVGAVPAGVAALVRSSMMNPPRWIWLAVPLALGVGAAGGVAAMKWIPARPSAAPADPKPTATRGQPPAVADAGKPPAAGGRSPFDLEGAVTGPEPREQEPPPKVDPPMVVRSRDGGGYSVELDPPPGYFDLPAPDKKDGTEPPTIKPGQVLLVEVLEALPGRPITGERVVRPDGTISLGFYGDLRVAGLNRYQIKVKFIEHMRKYLVDDALGLFKVDMVSGKCLLVPPVESNRVFVDDSLNDQPAGRDPVARPIVRGDRVDPEADARFKQLETKLDQILKELEGLRGGNRPAEPTAGPSGTTPRPPNPLPPDGKPG